MPFPENYRKWRLRVAGDGDATKARCEYQFITETKGVTQCQLKGEQVHHLIPESELITLGINPNTAPSLVVCIFHHIMGQGDMLAGDGSFHPDMGQARSNYHLNPNSFKEAAQEHVRKALKGERINNGDWGTDNYFIDLYQQTVGRYLATHPDDPMPKVKPHKKVSHLKHWYDVFFGGDDGNS